MSARRGRLGGVLFLLLLAAAPRSEAGGAGTSAVPFLRLGAGARPAGMGNAFAALATDVHALSWNVGGLGFVDTREFQFMHNEYFQDVRQEYVAYVHPGVMRGSIGVFVNYMDEGDFIRETISSGTFGRPLGTFGARSWAAGIAYGRMMTPRLSAGVTAKYVRQEIDIYDAGAFAADLGVLYDLPLNGARLGLTVQNLGGRLGFASRREKLPLTFRGGLGYAAMDGRLNIASDLVAPESGEVYGAAGVEFWLAPSLAIRGGYDGGNDAGDGWTVGAGVRLRGFTFDYAYVPFGKLGESHRASVNYAF